MARELNFFWDNDAPNDESTTDIAKDIDVFTQYEISGYHGHNGLNIQVIIGFDGS